MSFILISGCKKKKLKGRHEALIGEWEWSYSIGVYKTGPYSTSQDTFVPTKDTYSLNFKKKGILEFKKNNEIINEVFLKQNKMGMIAKILTIVLTVSFWDNR